MDETVNNYLKEIAKKGGDTTSKRYGKEYYKELQRKSVEARRKNKAKTAT